MYSGGILSYLTAKRVVAQVPREQVVLLFCDTKTEDQDLYRFLVETSNFLDIPITWLQDGRDVWQVMFQSRFLSNQRLAKCSQDLKQKVAKRWLEENGDQHVTVQVFGFSWDEKDRAQRLEARNPETKYWFPLIDEVCTYEAQQAEVLADGIQIPRLYKLGFEHNNCGGFCVKAGKKYFKNLLTQIPERYAYHEQKEQELLTLIGQHGKHGLLRDRRNKVTRFITLKQYREMLESDVLPVEEINGDVGSCGCFINDMGDSMDQFGFGMDEDNGLGFGGTVDTTYDDVFDQVEVVDGVGTDDVWDAEIDHAEEDRIIKRAMAPAGYYEVAKLDCGGINERVVEYYEEVDNGLRLVKKTRKRVSYYGMGQKEHDGRIVNTRLRFSICPTPGYGKEYQTGEPSLQKLSNDFKLYQACKKAYEQVMGEKPKSPRQVLDYLSQYPVKLRTMQGNDGLVVLDVLGIKV